MFFPLLPVVRRKDDRDPRPEQYGAVGGLCWPALFVSPQTPGGTAHGGEDSGSAGRAGRESESPQRPDPGTRGVDAFGEAGWWRRRGRGTVRGAVCGAGGVRKDKVACME